MNVSSLIRRDVTSCTIHDNLHTAAQLMWDRDLGCLPVIDDQGHVAGMITDRDACMAAYIQDLPLRAIPVSVAMARHVFACHETDDVDAVESVMRAHQIHRMPVVDDQGHPVGILSLNDLVRAAASGSVPAPELVATMAAVSAPREIFAPG